MKARTFLLAILLLASVVMVHRALAETLPLQTVAHVDLKRYSGHWYEIARYPNWFERNCVADATASYTPLADGRMEVLNACKLANGTVKISKGKAVVADAASNARLKVTFFWPFWGNYWVIDLAPDYSYAVVGEPSRKYLWILSRTPQLSEATMSQILTHMEQKGYDPSPLIKTPQH